MELVRRYQFILMAICTHVLCVYNIHPKDRVLNLHIVHLQIWAFDLVGVDICCNGSTDPSLQPVKDEQCCIGAVEHCYVLRLLVHL